MNVLIWGMIIVVVMRSYAERWLHWSAAAVLVVAVPYIVEVGAWAIAQKVWDKDPAEAFALAMFRPVTAILQLCIAFGVFYWLERREESLTAWAVGISMIFIGMVYVAPYIGTHWL